MKALINKLCWSIHRALCYVGIHATEKTFRFYPSQSDLNESSEFEMCGWFCGVCTKSWGKDDVEF